MSLAKYDKYKDSGVDWLGEIPEHWEVRRIKDVVKVNPSTLKNVKNQNSLIEFLPMSNVNEITGTIKEYNFEPYENIKQGYTAFKNEDVLFAKITPCMENGNCVVVDGLKNNLGFGSTEFIVFRTDRIKLTNKHIFQFLRNAKFLKKAENFMIGAAGQRRISSEYLKIHPIAVPPLPEQTTIATYLDRKTSAIDKKTTLLEQKTTHYLQLHKSLINETVCRGLDKNVKLKDSGIEWIGEIPEHWEVKRLKDVCGFINRGSSPNYDETGSHKVVNQATYSKGFWDESSLRFTQNLEIKPRGLLKEDDILIASTGGGVLGKVFFFNKKESDYIADSHITILRDTQKSYFSKYVYYYFSEKFKLINDILAQGSTNQTELQKDWLLAFSICIPPKQEQIAIANYLDEKTQKIDSIVSNIRSQIETLKELRKTLINDVVTGKIKVTE